MTKKMFQVTRAGMVAVTIFICLNLLLDKKVMVGDGHIWERCAWLLISLVAFLAVSVLYEKKRKIFSVGYLFLLINVFIDGVLCPGYFTDSRLREMEREGVQEPQDFFLLYLGVYFIIMAVIFLYLLCVKQTTDEVKQSDFIRYCLYRVRTNRFLFIQYIMPLLLIFFLFVAVNDNYKKGKKVVPLLIFPAKSTKRMVVKSKNRSRSGSDFYFLLPSRDDCYLTFSTEAIVPSKGSTSDNAPV